MPHQIIVVDNESYLSYSNNHLIYTDFEDKSYDIFLENLNLILIYNNKLTFTAYLMNELIKRNIGVVFFNEKYNPTFQLMPFYGSFNCSGNLNKQIAWHKDIKEKLWIDIIRNKIANQQSLLVKLGLDHDNRLISYLDRLLLNDPYNIEGITAKVYFHRMFGSNFIRRSDDDINAMLNYTYSILLSCINRNISICGYNTMIGINHASATNNFNLSYDIIEPFRPFADEIVYKCKGRVLNKDVKNYLLNVLFTNSIYGDKTYPLYLTIELYINDLFKSLNSNKNLVKMIKLY